MIFFRSISTKYLAHPIGETKVLIMEKEIVFKSDLSITAPYLDELKNKMRRK